MCASLCGHGIASRSVGRNGSRIRGGHVGGKCGGVGGQGGIGRSQIAVGRIESGMSRSLVGIRDSIGGDSIASRRVGVSCGCVCCICSGCIGGQFCGIRGKDCLCCIERRGCAGKLTVRSRLCRVSRIVGSNGGGCCRVGGGGGCICRICRGGIGC